MDFNLSLNLKNNKLNIYLFLLGVVPLYIPINLNLKYILLL